MSFKLLLVQSSDVADREFARTRFFEGHQIQYFTPEVFYRFVDEMQTIKMFGSTSYICLQEVDTLPPEQLLLLKKLLESSLKDVWLCLEAKALKGELLALIQQKGQVETTTHQKPWEKQQKTIQILIEKSAAEGVVLRPEIAKNLVMTIGLNPQLLFNELDKLICYVGETKEITQRAIQALTPALAQETLWELIDAIYARQVSVAFKVLQGLLQEQVVPLALIANLRTQIINHRRLLQLASHEGQAAALKEFPYLKGKLYEKKVQALKVYGQKRLDFLCDLLFQEECALKNNPLSPNWPLEKLILLATT